MLSAKELLEGVYNTLKRDGREIKLPSEAKVEIVDDSNWRRTRIGYIYYESATILEVGKKKWAVAFGTMCRNPYNCDIAAVQLSDDGKSDEVREAQELLEQNDCFYNSLIHATIFGLASNKKGRFGKKIHELLEPQFHEFFEEDLERDPRHPMGYRTQYKAEFLVVLRNAFLTVLAS